jgi:hypothetical protein
MPTGTTQRDVIGRFGLPARVAHDGSTERGPVEPRLRRPGFVHPADLRTYDTLVVTLSNSLVWRCPARRILDHHDADVTGRHLDIGPGTGYHLDRCRFPVADPSTTLLDPDREVLEYAAARVARYRPATHAADALEPIELPAASSFGSVDVVGAVALFTGWPGGGIGGAGAVGQR